MSNSGNISQHKSRDLVALETTAAANAQIEAPTSPIARGVGASAGRVDFDIARDVTSTAHGASLSGNTTSALNQLQQQASETLNEAVAQGQHDVEAVKSTIGAEVDQAKNLASSAISTAQSYLPDSVSGQAKNVNGPSTAAPSQSGAASTLEKTKGYLASVQETAQSHIENAKGMAQGFLGTAGGEPLVRSNDNPATKAQLESIGGQTKTANGNSVPGVVASLPSNVASALETTKEYLAAAQETAQPHIENAKSVTQSFLGTAGTQGLDAHGKPPVPSKDSAPLENGARTYSSKTGANVGQNMD